jgi:hypothetical protein
MAVIPDEKPNGMSRATTSGGNQAAMLVKAGYAAVAAEGSAKGPYVDRQACS